MPSKRLLTYWQMAVLTGLVGALVGAAIVFLAPNRYICFGTLILQDQVKGAQAWNEVVQELTLQSLNRDVLISIIMDPYVDLYREERKRMPMEDIAENLFRKRIRVFPLSREIAGRQGIAIQFEYSDPSGARNAVQRLLHKFMDNGLKLPVPISLTIPRPVALPRTPIRPPRAIIHLGAIVGMLLGVLALTIWRRTRSYAIVRMGVPKETLKLIDDEVAAGHFPDATEYLRALIRADQERKAAG